MSRRKIRGVDRPERRRGAIALLALVLAAVVAVDSTPVGTGRAVAAPQALDRTVAVAADDGEESLVTGAVQLGSADLELGVDVDPQVVGMRFTDLSIPRGATVTAAWIQFSSARSTSGATALTIAGQAADNAAAFGRSTGNLSTRPVTAATVAWNPASWSGVGTTGTDQRTPDIADIVQELVDRPGWNFGNAAVLLVRGTGRRTAESFEGPLALPPTLHVEFSDGPIEPPPPPNPSGPVRFAVIGDYGDASPGAAAVAALVNSQTPDFVVTVGDNAYIPSLDQAVGAFYAPYIGAYAGSYGAGSPVNRFFPAIGNHEYTDLPGGIADYEAYFTLPGEGIASSNTSGNERYYDFVRGPVHFFVLNSNFQEPAGRSATSAQAQWLQQQLAASTSAWNIVVLHHPPFSSATGGETSIMRWPFAAWGADAVMAGHAHVYERLSIDGIPYFVNGIGGDGTGAFQPQPLDADRARYNGGLGAMIVDACAARLSFAFHSVYQGVLDSYALGATDCTGATPVNQVPYAFAGLDQTVSITAGAALAGVAADDGPVSVIWTQLSGPGTATFANTQQASTSVAFSAPGPYLLQLAASDGAQTSTDTIEVVVTSATYLTLDVPIATSSDDAEEALTTGVVQLTSSDLEFGVDVAPQVVGLRFANVGLPPGATIRRAYVQFVVDEVASAAANLTVTGQATPNAPTFSVTPGDLAARVSTAASVPWGPAPWPAERANGFDQRTPDLAPVVQEIIGLNGWSVGNPLVVLVRGTGVRTAESFDGEVGATPVLHVEYSPRVTGGGPVTIHASSETTALGTVSAGTLASTRASDNAYERLTEANDAAPKATRLSYLDHTWIFTLPANAAPVTFAVEAHHGSNSEGDDFLFAYSLNGVDFTNMVVVTKTSDNGTTQTHALPPGTSGQVSVRVTDLDRTPGRHKRQHLDVDAMSFTVG